ncbi:NAD-dependent epimerase/dehydratase family protein [Candidatus Micrarchaeota archaeon]|nr:NAD-dependent epimerase/dehydratase family protein [Candidatus Micrarchaeota archaeon]
MRILVTGAAGFMGSHLVDALVAAGHEVHGVDDLSGGYMRNVNPKSHFAKLDLRERAATAEYVGRVRPEVVFHLAADATEGRSQFTPVQCTERNYLAYLNTLVPAIRTGALKKMVLTSSMSVYGAQKPPFSEEMPRLPEDVYGISKAAMERSTEILSEVHGFEYVIIRPHNVYGPQQNLADPYRNVIGIFINRLLNGKPFFIYGDGEQKRAFSYIDDFTPYIVKAGLNDSANGEIFNIGPVEETSINQLGQVVLEQFFKTRDWDKKFAPKHLPPRPKEVKEAFCTVGKAERMLGYKTTVHLEEGVGRMIEWARAIGPQKPVYLDDLEIVNGQVPSTWKEKLI